MWSNKNKKISKWPITDIISYYTGEIIKKLWKNYFVLDTKKLINKFGDDNHAVWGKKAAPIYIRKAKIGETIITYVQDEEWETVEESTLTAKKWQYIFQNTNDVKDTYICQKNNIIKDYEVVHKWTILGKEFTLCKKRNPQPEKLLLEIIKKPSVITIASWGNIQQFLEEWATLKLRESWGKLEVVGINKWGFESRELINAYKNK